MFTSFLSTLHTKLKRWVLETQSTSIPRVRNKRQRMASGTRVGTLWFSFRFSLQRNVVIKDVPIVVEKLFPKETHQVNSKSGSAKNCQKCVYSANLTLYVVFIDILRNFFVSCFHVHNWNFSWNPLHTHYRCEEIFPSNFCRNSFI